jgi:hypothetical protein
VLRGSPHDSGAAGKEATMAMSSSDFHVEVSAMPETLRDGTVWFGSATVSGMQGGERFSATFDFSHTDFATREQAEQFALECAKQKIAAGWFGGPHRLSPASDPQRDDARS